MVSLGVLRAAVPYCSHHHSGSESFQKQEPKALLLGVSSTTSWLGPTPLRGLHLSFYSYTTSCKNENFFITGIIEAAVLPRKNKSGISRNLQRDLLELWEEFHKKGKQNSCIQKLAASWKIPGRSLLFYPPKLKDKGQLLTNHPSILFVQRVFLGSKAVKFGRRISALIYRISKFLKLITFVLTTFPKRLKLNGWLMHVKNVLAPVISWILLFLWNGCTQWNSTAPVPIWAGTPGVSILTFRSMMLPLDSPFTC